MDKVRKSLMIMVTIKNPNKVKSSLALYTYSYFSYFFLNHKGHKGKIHKEHKGRKSGCMRYEKRVKI